VLEQLFCVLIDQPDGSDDIPLPETERVTKPYVWSRCIPTESDDHKPSTAQVNVHVRRRVFTRWAMQAHDEALRSEMRRHSTITYLMGLFKAPRPARTEHFPIRRPGRYGRPCRHTECRQPPDCHWSEVS